LNPLEWGGEGTDLWRACTTITKALNRTAGNEEHRWNANAHVLKTEKVDAQMTPHCD